MVTKTLPGQVECGDRYLVHPLPQGVLLAVVDGLGHGEEAVAAATLAIATLQAYAQEPVVQLVQCCHDRLRSTRGVVMSVASIRGQDSSMTWIGIGDVEGLLMHAVTSRAQPLRESLPLRGGVVGYQLPPLRATTVTVTPGDLLVFATDGVRTSFVQEPLLSHPLLRQVSDGPQQLASQLLESYGKGTDDALVLVARYRGDAG
ncbi:MAG: SpoIIE family protein phosphatase [Candidatus Binatia bacterium]|nr:SpoIIE family protein phosphatase [Candidatus Binatia bacterium]